MHRLSVKGVKECRGRAHRCRGEEDRPQKRRQPGVHSPRAVHLGASSRAASTKRPDRVRYGFVIDQRRCIGCHACTVACKEENDVPVGAFRTWVKYVERGEWPGTRRHFSVLRCNHCESAPCVTICPTRALYTRDDGIVDFDRDRCIGCKACMQGCRTTRCTSTPTRIPRRSATTARIASRAGSSPHASSSARSRRSSPATSTIRRARSRASWRASRSRCARRSRARVRRCSTWAPIPPRSRRRCRRPRRPTCGHSGRRKRCPWSIC